MAQIWKKILMDMVDNEFVFNLNELRLNYVHPLNTHVNRPCSIANTIIIKTIRIQSTLVGILISMVVRFDVRPIL